MSRDIDLNLTISEGDFSNILTGLYRLRDDFLEQLADPKQSNLQVMCKLKIKELDNLLGRLEIEYQEG